ncbi:hypothetical protein [Streptomyces kanamyceticus]|uniref:Uncharacterized protein n=1 Tax=Streptomyces kanamyceticus TaxID=1967 RepID=A0A5J6GIP2_STRKN|nr:hypothetical protein [Streptomyces kanamyceticus]QEU94312.1 hypothetical protein CP970_28470 [Streptomyces kanamyceticus]
MDLTEAVTAFLASVLGAVAGAGMAVHGAREAARRLVETNDQEQRRAETAALRAAVMEVGVAERIAKARSTTDLPTQMLTTVLPVVHHMKPEQQQAMIAYSQSVLRYNGQVQRIVAYGAAETIKDEHAGAEKLTEHSDAVRDTAPAASDALKKHMALPRRPDGDPGERPVTDSDSR